MNELVKRLEKLISEITNLKSHLNLPQKEQKILEMEDQMAESSFWENSQLAQKISQQYNQLKTFYDFWQKLETEAKELLSMSKNAHNTEKDVKELKNMVGKLESAYEKNKILALLSKKYDDHNAILAIHAGAGGSDAQDWAGMLLRMYLRYCEQKGFKTEIIETSKGQEAGIKSALFEVIGPFAYGFLKAEAGVHRLVRLSPFNQAHTRETSFALVEVLPILEEQETFKLDPKDLKIEATTSSGHGGQSVNTTYSAIRITHMPTGAKVSIQNERSQHQNRELALKIIAAKVQAIQEEKLAKEKMEIRGEFKSAEWGNQIRSYVLHPYKLVKDHRTNYEVTNPEKVLNGEFDDFIERYLEKTTQNKIL